MSLRICILSSGSSGNCTYVASEKTAILIDAGISGKRVQENLALIGADLSEISAVCLTHEHDDHKSALAVLQRKVGMALYANAATIESLERSAKTCGLTWNVFTTGQPFEIGDLRIEPFSVPHDAYDPVGFIVSNATARVGIVTDMGVVTGLIRERLRNCDAVVIEANHDEEMLRNAERPWSLKQRIASRQGHLSNQQAAELAAGIAHAGLKSIVLAHLSADCNMPHLAVNAIKTVLEGAGFAHIEVTLSYPDRISQVIELQEGSGGNAGG